MVSESIAGETRRLGPTTLSVRLPVRLEPLTNVKLLFTVCREAHCFSDIYAKVSAIADSEDSREQPLHRLDITYMDQADKVVLNRWIDVSKPHGEEFIWP